VIAIAGNHDKTFVNSEEETWLEYLAAHDLLILLETRFAPSGPITEPWNGQTRRGSWFELDGVRFTGAGYLGAATPHKVRQIVEGLQPGRPHVLLLHAGPDYFVGEGGGFSSDDLRFIRERVAYLALGHIHKPMIHDGWACNPGSPENCDLHESHYDLGKSGVTLPRGYAWVEIEPASDKPLRALEIRSNPRRPVIHLSLDCTPFGNKLREGAAALEKAACERIAQSNASKNAAVDLRLAGKINLGRIALDLQIAAQNIEQVAGVAAVALDATAINLDGAFRGENPGDAALSREEVERASISNLVEEEHLWGLDGEQAAIANLFLELKEAVRNGRSEDEMAEQIQLSALIEKIHAARSSQAPPPGRAAQPNPIRGVV
jgi:DNA repair exonuclease SbcCD nuclease subunit